MKLTNTQIKALVDNLDVCYCGALCSEHSQLDNHAAKSMVDADEWLPKVLDTVQALQEEKEELVKALSDLAQNGFDDFGGSYVNLQVQKSDVEEARALLSKYTEGN